MSFELWGRVVFVHAWYSSFLIPETKRPWKLTRTQGKLVKFEESNKELNITDPRDKDVSSMSISSMLAAHEKHHGTFNDRLHVWAAAGTPRGSPLSSHLGIGEACKERDIGLTMHCAEAPRDLAIY